MSFPRHSRYRETGVSWLGAVPEHWKVERLKHAGSVILSNVDKKSIDGEAPVLLCNYTDVYYNDSITAGLGFMPATASSDQITRFTLRAGDIIVTKDSETADDIAVAAYVPDDLPGVLCGYHLSIVRPGPGHSGAFIKRLFDSVYAKCCFAVLANGLTRFGLGQYELDNVLLPFPPYEEQVRIASFLDRETGKIDELVGEQRKLIELLKEKRQTVITNAVTRGLDRNTCMKPSGIEWLDEVPQQWDTVSLKHLARPGRKTFTDGDWIESPFIEQQGVRLIQTGNIGIGIFKEQGFRYVSERTCVELHCTQVDPEDVLICRLDGPVGRACLAPDLGVRMITSVDNAILKVASNVVRVL